MNINVWDTTNGLLRILARLQVFAVEFELLIFGLCTLFGIVFIVVGLRAATLRSELGPARGGWAGPISWVLCGVVFLGMPRFLGVLSQSVFSRSDQVGAHQILAYAPDMVDVFAREHSLATIEGIIQVVQVIGLIGVVRGIFLLNNALQPAGQGGLGAGITHLIGGILAYNIVVFMGVLNDLFVS